jgi:hypothetical protein
MIEVPLTILYSLAAMIFTGVVAAVLWRVNRLDSNIVKLYGKLDKLVDKIGEMPLTYVTQKACEKFRAIKKTPS